jgi:hypothetical protein
MEAADLESRGELVRWLSDPRLRRALQEALERFEGGHDPWPFDEELAEGVLRARALLEATAPSPDPLKVEIATLDANWQPLCDVGWLLADERWASCFSGLSRPPCRTWWGARAASGVPSESDVLRALTALRDKNR